MLIMISFCLIVGLHVPLGLWLFVAMIAKNRLDPGDVGYLWNRIPTPMRVAAHSKHSLQAVHVIYDFNFRA